MEEARKKAIKELEELQDSGDVEMAHGEADEILMNLLTELGYGDVVEAYDCVPKWYA